MDLKRAAVDLAVKHSNYNISNYKPQQNFTDKPNFKVSDHETLLQMIESYEMLGGEYAG